ncbi:MAG TPA: hypothetical protein PKE05_02220 [Microthrixaceae bacterium]|nr:hypothetical protein [Microthrixaceae bacterium]HMT26421.1 hypothetical protein [Microthrixaceae bacterium]HMT62366.1 hypothetical protein [Microthrixaceae bacterium]
MSNAGLGSPPVATAAETVEAILNEGGRDHSPIRISFLQRADDGSKSPGPLAEFVTNGDRRGLLLYLLLIAKATTSPWDAALPSAVWARALGVPLPNSKGAASSISKTWLRLEQRGLVSRERSKRRAKITLLREDGSGAAYTHPGTEGGYFKLPHAFWREGPAADQRWSQLLTLPELAMLLIACSHKARFRLPLESAPEWYGISADTASRGFHGLETSGALIIDRTYKSAPLAPAGYTSENRYTLRPPFGHRHDLTTGLVVS